MIKPAFPDCLNALCACVTVAALCSLVPAGSVAAAEDIAAAGFEEPDTVPVESVLPPKFLHSAHYAIEPDVRADDNFYRFVVTTDDGNYHVTSLAMLRVRLFEIVTAAEVAPRIGAKRATLDRSPGGRRGVESEYVLDIFTDPVGTAAQLLSNIEYNVEQTFEGDDDDTQDRSPRSAAVDLNPSPHKRSAAAQLRVDVYSSNPQLQKILNAVADARSAGKTASSISPLITDPYAVRPFGSGLLNTQLDSYLKNTSSEDLHAEIDGTMQALGVSADLRITFLTHPAYTPRTRLYFTTYTELLKPVEHLDWLFKAATNAATEADAMAYVNYARMLAFAQLNSGKLTEVITDARFPTLATSDGNAVLALPLDFLAWTRDVAAAADALRQIREGRGLKRFIVLLAGTPTTRAQAELALRQVDIRTRYSF